MDSEAEIRKLLARRMQSLEQGNAAEANAVLDSQLVAFEVAGPLQITGLEATDSRATQMWLDSFDEGPFVTMDELAVFVDGDTAFCHSLNNLRGLRNGQKLDLTLRSTLGLRKNARTWKIIHSHTSLPR